jgi:TonB family protein
VYSCGMASLGIAWVLLAALCVVGACVPVDFAHVPRTLESRVSEAEGLVRAAERTELHEMQHQLVVLAAACKRSEPNACYRHCILRGRHSRALAGSVRFRSDQVSVPNGTRNECQNRSPSGREANDPDFHGLIRSFPQVMQDTNSLPYPRQALEHGVEGHVTLEIEISADGKALDVLVSDSAPLGLFERATEAAARRWSYVPAKIGGRAVPALWIKTFLFCINPSSPYWPSGECERRR